MRVVTVTNEQNQQTFDLNALEDEWLKEYAFRNTAYNGVTKTFKWLTVASVFGTLGYMVYLAFTG